MAISTIDGAINGFQYQHYWMKNAASPSSPLFYSLVYATGVPSVATAPSPGMAGEALTSYEGQLPFSNPPSGNSYLHSFSSTANDVLSMMVYDRLWQNSGIDVTNTGAQTINSVAFPARDGNGSTNGAGVLVALEVGAAMGAATPTLTLSYTNSDGTAGRTGTSIYNTISGSAVGSFYIFSLQGADKGVRSIQTITLGSSWLSGSVNLVAFRILARTGSWAGTATGFTDWITHCGTRLYDGTVPCLMTWARTSSSLIYNGTFTVTQG